MKLLPPIEKTVACFAKLPGIGRRSAERMTMKLVSEKKESLLNELIAALQEMQSLVKQCSVCGSLTTIDQEPCAFCSDPSRDRSSLCVVEDVADVFRIEATGCFKGVYHVFGGKISPLRGEGIDDGRLSKLMEHVKKLQCREIILAMNMDIEGDATAHFLKELFEKEGIVVSRPAMGIPAGSAISYTDSITLANALKARQNLIDL